MPTIDFSQVPDLEPVPPGNYFCEIVYAQVGTSGSGQPKIDLRWKVLEAPAGVGSDENLVGRQIFDHLSFHPNALYRVKATLKALSFAPDFSGEVLPEDLISRQAVLRVTIEQSEGTNEAGEPYGPRNRILKVSPASQRATLLFQ